MTNGTATSRTSRPTRSRSSRPLVHEPTGFTIEETTVCASDSACRKRWLKPTEDEMDRRFA